MVLQGRHTDWLFSAKWTALKIYIHCIDSMGIFRTIYVYTNTYMHAITTGGGGGRGTNVKESREEYVRGLEGRRVKGQ